MVKQGIEEGRATEVMHIGPFSEKGPTIEKVHSFIEEYGGNRKGKHHEIYLTDIKRAAAVLTGGCFYKNGDWNSQMGFPKIDPGSGGCWGFADWYGRLLRRFGRPDKSHR